MTALGLAAADRRPHSLLTPVRDTLAVTRRNLTALFRVPQLLVFTLIQPVIFVLLFRFVFGGAITIPGGIPYVDYLMPGIFVQTAVFGSMVTAIGMAADIKSGIIERFRSLPMSPSAVLAGRTIADLARNVLVVAIMAVVGFIVGFRIHTNYLLFFCGLLLVLAFGYTLSWTFALIGMAVKDPETAQAAAFPIIAPLVFASSVFVPVSSMPTWLQGFATHQPVSVTASAVRALMIGGPTTSLVLQCLGWMVLIIAICAPWSVHLYRKAV